MSLNSYQIFTNYIYLCVYTYDKAAMKRFALTYA